jgi:hypothetical protein
MIRQVVRSPAVVIAALLAVALAVALALAVASGIRGRSAGPLQALSAGGELTVDGASVAVPPGGSADFTAFVVNPLRSPIRLVSATVVPVTGERPPDLLRGGLVSSRCVRHDQVQRWSFAMPQRCGKCAVEGQADGGRLAVTDSDPRLRQVRAGVFGWR